MANFCKHENVRVDNFLISRATISFSRRQFFMELLTPHPFAGRYECLYYGMYILRLRQSVAFKVR